MYLGKIVVKNNYEKKGDLVYRPLIRAYHENGLDSFISGDNVYLLGIVRDNIFYELFTWKSIPYSDYEIITYEEFDSILDSLPLENARILKKTINNFVFNKNSDKNYNASSIEELAKDRMVEFMAYNNNLTDINPYEEPLNGYNDFEYKCKVLNKKGVYNYEKF